MTEQETTCENQEQQVYEAGVIHDVGLLDLRSAKDAERLKGIKAIRDVGTIIISETLQSMLAGIAISDVGMVVPVPEGANVSVQVGQLRMSGEALAEPAEDTILVLVGQILITSPVRKVGYREIRMMGQILAPRGSEAALAAKVSNITGQIVYYPWTGPEQDLRVLVGDNTLDADFLEQLAGPTVLIIVGNAKFAEDITPEALKVKVPGMLLVGNVAVPRTLRGVVQALSERVGNLMVYPPGARFFSGDDTLVAEDFEYMPESSAMAITGELTFAKDVTPDLVKAKVRDIALTGVLRAPKRLLPLLRSLISEKTGTLQALGEDEPAE